MKPFFAAVVLLAIAGSSCGQFTTPKPLMPKTECGSNSQDCYSRQKSDISTKLGNLDFEGACKSLKTALVCMDSLTTADCSQGGSGDRERRAIRQGAINDQGGICATDGTVQSCGTDAKVCVVELKNIITLFKSTNATAACPVLLKFKACTQSVLHNNECGPKLNDYFSRLEDTYFEDELVRGCDGPCGEEVGKCAETASTFTPENILKGELGDYCRDVYKGVQCIDNLKNNAACNGKTESVMLIGQSVESQTAAVKDICNRDGTMAPCASNFVMCLEDLRQVTKGSSVAEQCKATAKYLECVYLLPCTTSLRSFIDQLTQSFETDEMQMNCPSVGQCKDRIDVCGNNDEVLESLDPTKDKDRYCKIIKQSNVCFNTVRNDPICLREKATLTDFEGIVKKDVKGTCGGGAAIKFSLLLILVSLTASLRRFV